MEVKNNFDIISSSPKLVLVLLTSLVSGCISNTIKPINFDDPKNCRFLSNKEYQLHDFFLCNKYQDQTNKNIIKVITIRLPWCKTIQEKDLIKIRKCVKRKNIGVPDFCIDKGKTSRC